MDLLDDRQIKTNRSYIIARLAEPSLKIVEKIVQDINVFCQKAGIQFRAVELYKLNKIMMISMRTPAGEWDPERSPRKPKSTVYRSSTSATVIVDEFKLQSKGQDTEVLARIRVEGEAMSFLEDIFSNHKDVEKATVWKLGKMNNLSINDDRAQEWIEHHRKPKDYIRIPFRVGDLRLVEAAAEYKPVFAQKQATMAPSWLVDQSNAMTNETRKSLNLLEIFATVMQQDEIRRRAKDANLMETDEDRERDPGWESVTSINEENFSYSMRVEDQPASRFNIGSKFRSRSSSKEKEVFTKPLAPLNRKRSMPMGNIARTFANIAARTQRSDKMRGTGLDNSVFNYNNNGFLGGKINLRESQINQIQDIASSPGPRPCLPPPPFQSNDRGWPKSGLTERDIHNNLNNRDLRRARSVSMETSSDDQDIQEISDDKENVVNWADEMNEDKNLTLTVNPKRLRYNGKETKWSLLCPSKPSIKIRDKRLARLLDSKMYHNSYRRLLKDTRKQIESGDYSFWDSEVEKRAQQHIAVYDHAEGKKCWIAVNPEEALSISIENNCRILFNDMNELDSNAMALRKVIDRLQTINESSLSRSERMNLENLAIQNFKEVCEGNQKEDELMDVDFTVCNTDEEKMDLLDAAARTEEEKTALVKATNLNTMKQFADRPLATSTPSFTQAKVHEEESDQVIDVGTEEMETSKPFKKRSHPSKKVQKTLLTKKVAEVFDLFEGCKKCFDAWHYNNTSSMASSPNHEEGNRSFPRFIDELVVIDFEFGTDASRCLCEDSDNPRFGIWLKLMQKEYDNHPEMSETFTFDNADHTPELLEKWRKTRELREKIRLSVFVQFIKELRHLRIMKTYGNRNKDLSWDLIREEDKRREEKTAERRTLKTVWNLLNDDVIQLKNESDEAIKKGSNPQDSVDSNEATALEAKIRYLEKEKEDVIRKLDEIEYQQSDDLEADIRCGFKDNIGKLCEDFLEKEDPIYEDIVNIVEAVESKPVIIGARGATLHR